MGVMVDLEAHCFPPATTLSGGWSDLGTRITFSSDSGTLHLFFKCHCMGLMWTCFSVADRSPMRDMNCRTGHTGPDRIDNILSVKVCQCSGVGLTLPSLRSNW